MTRKDRPDREMEENARMHAYPERYLQVLAAPDIHARVVGADLVEIVAINGKQSASHCRCPASIHTYT